MTIWDKAVDNWGDWQAAQHIAKKYDSKSYGFVQTDIRS